MDLESVLTSIEKNNIEYVRFEISDQYGIPRCKTIASNHFTSKAKEGLNFGVPLLFCFDPNGGTIDGTGFLDVNNYVDVICYPDFSTYKILPWCKNTARVIIDPTYQSKPVDAHPREIAKVQLKRLKDLGYSLLSAHEYEFFVLDKNTKEPAFDTMQWNSIPRSNFNLPFTQQIGHDLPLVGVDVESIETEMYPGQMEITYKPAFGIQAGDNAYTYKTSIKEIGLQHNYFVTFMTKLNPNEGSGAHLNHSLWDSDGKNSLFYDRTNPNGLSTVGQHWMAGILEHAPALTLLHSPTINCIKRHDKDNAFAPVNATWGVDNRSCALRVKIAGQKGTYIENRLGSSAGNPYISLAGMIIAGMDGIERQLPLPKAVVGSAYDAKKLPLGTVRLPGNMKDGIKAFLDDKIITKALGSNFVEVYIASKRHEMQCEENAKVNCETNWEKNYYSLL